MNLLAIKKLKNYLQKCTALDILALNCHPNNSASEELLYAKEVTANMITCELSKTRHRKKLCFKSTTTYKPMKFVDLILNIHQISSYIQI